MISVVVSSVVIVVVTLFSLASAQTIDIRPQPPPGLAEKITTLVGWVYWLALSATVIAVIWSAVSIFTGRAEGKAMLIISLVILAFLIALPEILKALGL